ncbi:putative carboxylesterase [Bisporella sp. PMI_857]|nr:putative carboxylesterase [Bisporella sp. PMI_857]
MSSTNLPTRGFLGHDGIIQYLGIKYATLKNAFSDAQIFDYHDLESLNATTYGPSAILAPDACNTEFGLIQKSLPITEAPQSETECLNLNITAPVETLSESSALPVFVFIHGGGFGTGSNSWPQYDQGRIIQLSRDMRTPVVGVGINYRLGPSGFMTSKELQDHGFSANNGLSDQLVALRWIQKHIALFGGDPKKVTCIGESAGGVSVMHQIEMNGIDLPFQQVVNMSGTPLMLKPLSPVIAESIYQTVTSILGLGNLPGEERVTALTAIPAAELLSKLPPGLPFMPVLDGHVLKNEISFAQLQDGTGPSQSPNINLLIGSCDMDSSIFGIMLAARKSGSLERFKKILNEAEPKYASELMAAYHIQDGMSDDEAWPLIMNFANDISFHATAEAYAAAWPSPTYRYRFREPNPWEGPWEGHSTHVLDIAYLFLNYTEHLTPSQEEVAVQFATDLIHFINQNAPFQKFEQGQRYVKEYISKDGEVITKDRSKEEAAFWPVLFSRIGYDSLLGVWGRFMGS